MIGGATAGANGTIAPGAGSLLVQAMAHPGNLISGNISSGILMIDPGTKANRVQGNFIGIDQAGGTALKNQTGVLITGGAWGT